MAPSSIYVYDVETFVKLRGTGLLGNVATQVVFNGPTGPISTEPNLDANSTSSLLDVFVPIEVAITAGTYSVTVLAVDDNGIRTIGPATFTVIERPLDGPPFLFAPEGVFAEAQSSRGAFVDFSVTAMSQNGQPLVAACSPQSGTLFSLDRTGVTCSATDSGGTTTASFDVFVFDTTAPVLTLPNRIVTNDPVVTFTASAVDAIDGSVSVTCSPQSGSTFAIGNTTVQCSATDSHGNSARGTFLVSVGQLAPPTLTLPPDITAEATGPAGAVVNFAVSTEAGASVVCSPPSGSTFALGTTTVDCTASKAQAPDTTGSFNVNVVDTTPPVLTVPNDIAVTANTGSAVVTFNVTATDAVAPNPSIYCDPTSGSTFTTGTTIVRCYAFDYFTFSQKTFKVTVTSDTTPPVLTLPADITAEATSAAGAAVTYNVSAFDETDGAVPVNCSHASGSTFGITTTTVQCSATDTHGNIGTGSFKVTVRDTKAPVVSVPADITAEATGASGAAVTFSATAADIVDGVVAVTCSPASGSTFGITTATVQCSSTDAHGNTGSNSFKVTVRDTTAPAVSVPADITAEATGASGASVTFSASASDLVDGATATTCAPASGSTFGITTTTVQCSSTDAHGNIGSASFKVTVRDTTPPALTVPANITAEATSAAGAAVTFTATATDIVDGNVAVTCLPASGSTFALGTTSVQCKATDAHNNLNSKSFNVTVVDSTAPAVLKVTATPGSLWPPDHKMTLVTVSVDAVDSVDASPFSHILSVTSNQPINGTGDGDTSPDWEITGPLTVNLRAERSSGVDRVYTITLSTVDDAGNSTMSTVQVKVTQPSKNRGVSH